MSKLQKFIDVGANLTDSMYSGIYHGSKKHEPDLSFVLQRAWDSGLVKIIITGTDLEESQKAIDLAKTNDRLFATVGCHPTRCLEFEKNEETPANYINKLKNLITTNIDKVVALGECGLDYDRLEFCSKDIQKKHFENQLELNKSLNLPLFLHCRNAATDLHAALKKYNFKGVVHSFDGTIEEARKFIDLGYYIGINGCSLKTENNLLTVKELPVDKMLFETDSPWCEIRPTHAGYKCILNKNILSSVKKEKWKCDQLVKSRNEPVLIKQVLDVVSTVKEVDPDYLSDIVFRNTNDLFFSS